MLFEIIRDDITRVQVDAIVNPSNQALFGIGGADGAIHRAAGPELLKECEALGGCEVGQAKITRGYKLPAKYVIHTVGPIWHGENEEEKLLADCYKNSLALAREYKLESIAFPLISSGIFGYPKDKALQIAKSVIEDFLQNNEMTVYLVVYDKASFKLSEKLASSINQYIDDKYVEEQLHQNKHNQNICARDISTRRGKNRNRNELEVSVSTAFSAEFVQKRSLDDLFNNIDETFSQMLFRLIDEKGMTDVEVYKRANVDRKHFSKIRNSKNYKPSKPTAIAFAVALRLNLDEAKDLLLSAGFALSHSSKFDIIIEYFIENNNYDIFEINEALFEFDQSLLGA